VEYDVLPERVDAADAVGYLESKIEALRQCILERPRPPLTTRLGAPNVNRWFGRFMYLFGEANGAIGAAANFGQITREHAAKMQIGLKGLVNFHTGTVIIGR